MRISDWSSDVCSSDLVSDSRNQRGCAKDADAGYRGQSARRFVGTCMLGQVVVHSIDPLIECSPLCSHVLDERQAAGRTVRRLLGEERIDFPLVNLTPLAETIHPSEQAPPYLLN